VVNGHGWIGGGGSVYVRCALVSLIVWFPAVLSSAGPKPETQTAWDEYIQKIDLRTKQEVAGDSQFLWIDQDPLRAASVLRGEILASSRIDGNIARAVPSGLIHDWIGAVFIPDVTLSRVFAVVHEYGRYPDFYAPTVADAALLSSQGEDESFRIRYVRKVLFVSEVLDSEYSVHTLQINARRRYSVGHSTRLQDVGNRDGSAESRNPASGESRYVWRIYNISKYEHRDGGVYVEQENIVLSPAIPGALRWLVEPVVRRLSKQLTLTLLRQTRDAVISDHSAQDFTVMRRFWSLSWADSLPWLPSIGSVPGHR
jgi:hypothetical protein